MQMLGACIAPTNRSRAPIETVHSTSKKQVIKKAFALFWRREPPRGVRSRAERVGAWTPGPQEFPFSLGHWGEGGGGGATCAMCMYSTPTQILRVDSNCFCLVGTVCTLQASKENQQKGNDYNICNLHLQYGIYQSKSMSQNIFRNASHHTNFNILFRPKNIVQFINKN